MGFASLLACAYPVNSGDSKSRDLVNIRNHKPKAQGPKTYLSGHLLIQRHQMEKVNLALKTDKFLDGTHRPQTHRIRLPGCIQYMIWLSCDTRHK